LILSGELEHTDQRLADLSTDPASSFVDIATAVRRANELRPDLEELHALLAELDERARAFRGAWLRNSRPEALPLTGHDYETENDGEFGNVR
jgi:hypothetical protein